MPASFRDDGRGVDCFGGFFLVVCPRCASCAQVAPGRGGAVRLACSSCGRCADQSRRGAGPAGHDRILIGAPVDWYFQLPLWLQAPVRGRTLWAYNEEHLSFIEDYIGALRRKRRRDDALGWRNASLTSRLPRWLKAAGARRQALSALKALRRRLPPLGKIYPAVTAGQYARVTIGA